jgi:fatty acid desaturase
MSTPEPRNCDAIRAVARLAQTKSWWRRDQTVTRRCNNIFVTLRSLSSYAREVRTALPPRAFRPVPSRLAWLALHLGVIVAGIAALYLRIGGWWAAPLYALVIGHSFAGAAFVGHETMHGAVVRHRGARQLVGWLSFLPFTMSPRLWVAWHNKTHHAHTMDEANDPDCYPSLTTYRRSAAARLADRVSFAHDRPAGWLTLALGFTGQSSQMLWRWSKTAPAMTRSERRLALFETFAGFAIWAAVLWLLGPARFVFAFALPLVIGNAIVIGYILTNHSLSPLTEINDPLVNSLSVTVPRIVDMLHLNFGLHVEHHLFPSMSSAYAPLVRDELKRRWPERYQSLPLITALRRLAETPRIYKTPTTLHDPLNGLDAPTLVPREAPSTGATASEPAAASEPVAAAI